MAGENILIIEDDPDLGSLVQYNLRREGFKVRLATSGEDGLAMVDEETPDLILLDVILPGRDGYQICRNLKSRVYGKTLQVIMLTARSEEHDIVSGFEIGADDYITKPFNFKVMSARIRARLRIASQLKGETRKPITIGRLYIDPPRHMVSLNDNPLNLTPTEHRILLHLVRKPGTVYSRYEIVDAVQGGEVVVTDRSVDVHIVGLRKKLGEYAQCIETVRGFGYRFQELSL
ncbi:MAG: response regulator transcription factor [candidate division Zixibacteria bacterium]|nr:response regulator transcription factor [candidate division Zixibacteria bacterium]